MFFNSKIERKVTMQSIESARKGACVVTFDVARSLQMFHSRSIHVPAVSDPIFAELRKNLLERMERAFPGFEICPIEKNDLRSKIWGSLGAWVNGHAVLVTCSEMAALNPDPHGLNLSINRLFDKNGKMLGYGPRPGYDYLSKQFDDLAMRIAGRPVVLAKEGAFKGNTCVYILDELGCRNVDVVVLVMGFCDVDARALIQQKFRKEFVTLMLFDNLVEWIADRDLIPFIPGCGRVMGEVSTHSFMPVRTANGFSCAFPYVLPFGLTEKWMSLGNGHASELSISFMDYAIELFARIDRENYRSITMGEILCDDPRVSIPVAVGDGIEIPASSIGIVEYLQKMRKML